MIVLEDDTMICEPCYADEQEGALPFDPPRHRWVFARIDSGVCESCGLVIDAGIIISTPGGICYSSTQNPEPER